MSLPLEPHRYTLHEYFQIEQSSSDKYEYRDGEVVNLSEMIGMTGGAIPHSLTTAKRKSVFSFHLIAHR